MEAYKEIVQDILGEDVSEAAIDKLFTQAQVVTYPERTCLARQGERADKFYMILEGCVDVYSEVGDKTFHLDVIRSGTFGEIGLLFDGVRTAFIYTRETTTVLEMKGMTFKRLSRDNPEILAAITKIVLKRLVDQDKRRMIELKEKAEHASQVNLLDKIFDDFPLEEVARRVYSRVSVYKAPNPDPQYQADVFMIMPFREQLLPVSQQVGEVAKVLGLKFKRGDDFFSHNLIMAEIWSVTNAAKLIVCDCTGKNPNVFYELGIAHTLGKPTILITQTAEDIPFDLQNFRYIVYNPTELERFGDELKEAIIKILMLGADGTY